MSIAIGKPVTVGDITTLTYNFQSNDPTKRTQEAWATVNSFCSNAVHAIQKKAMVGMAMMTNSFSISYRPWSSANLAQRTKTEAWAAQDAVSDFRDNFLLPALGFGKAVAWDVVSGFKLIGDTALNAGKGTLQTVNNLAEQLPKLPETLMKWLPIGLTVAVAIILLVKVR